MTPDDLRRYPWQALIESILGRQCQNYPGHLYGEAKRLQDAGDQEGSRVYFLLGNVSSYEPHWDNSTDPFGPAWSRVDGTHGPRPDDLTLDELDSLKGVLDEIRDHDMCARVADILWLRRRDHKAAMIAVDAYLDSSAALEALLWPPFELRLERAAALAASLGRRKPLHTKVLDRVESLVAKYKDEPSSGYLCARLLRILFFHGQGLPSAHASLARDIARREEGSGHWDIARDYWLLSEASFTKAGEAASAADAKLRAAEALSSKAEAIFTEGKLGSGSAAHWMEQALHALRQAGAADEHVDRAHQRMLELQRQSADEMEAHEFDETAIPGLAEFQDQAIEAACELVRGKSLEEAIFRLATIKPVVNPDELRQQVVSNAEQFPIQAMFPSEAVSSTGLVGRRAPAVTSSDPDKAEEGIRQQMYVMAGLRWQLSVNCFIEPIRNTIMQEHAVTRADLAFLVLDNAFVPPGREGIFLEGLRAGFHGDWLTAIHLLIPQIEQSLRVILTAHGIATSYAKDDGSGAQGERDMGWLLAHPKTPEILGAAMTFNLRAILIERFGVNMRNNLCHGLMSHGAFYGHPSVYLWWLVIRLICLSHGQYQVRREQIVTELADPEAVP